jgi:uncharacterized protein YheU (UPF0270 family)
LVINLNKAHLKNLFPEAELDYGAVEASLEAKFRQVKDKLKNGLAVLVFDDETKTTNIFLSDDPIMKNLDEVTR